MFALLVYYFYRSHFGSSTHPKYLCMAFHAILLMTSKAWREDWGEAWREDWGKDSGYWRKNPEDIGAENPWDRGKDVWYWRKNAWYLGLFAWYWGDYVCLWFCDKDARYWGKDSSGNYIYYPDKDDKCWGKDPSGNYVWHCYNNTWYKAAGYLKSGTSDKYDWYKGKDLWGNDTWYWEKKFDTTFQSDSGESKLWSDSYSDKSKLWSDSDSDESKLWSDSDSDPDSDPDSDSDLWSDSDEESYLGSGSDSDSGLKKVRTKVWPGKALVRTNNLIKRVSFLETVTTRSGNDDEVEPMKTDHQRIRIRRKSRS